MNLPLDLQHNLRLLRKNLGFVGLDDSGAPVCSR